MPVSTLTYQWQRSLTSVGGYANIVGATGLSYTPVSGDTGYYIHVVETATTDGGTATSTSNPIGPIGVNPQTPIPQFAALGPQIFVECDFTAAALVGSPPAPVWTDLSPYANRGSLSTKRGRPNVLDKIEAGTATADMNNDDRRFEPEYAGFIDQFVLNPSFELTASDWFNGGGNATVSQNNYGAIPGSAKSMRMTQSALGDFYASPPAFIPATAGKTYTISSYFRNNSGNCSMLMQVNFYDAASTLLATNYPGTSISYLDLFGGVWQRGYVTMVAPAGTTQMLIYTRALNVNGGATNTVDVDCVMVNEGPLKEYVDGSMPNGRWSGAPHASTSYRGGPYYPNLTPMRRFRIRAIYNSVTYFLHQGNVETWPLDWPSMRRATTSITSTDGFGRLNQTLLSGVNDPGGTGLLVIAGARSGAYIDSVLTLAQWEASAAQRIDGLGGTIAAAGAEDLIGVSLDYTQKTSSLDLIQSAADSEFGLFFMDGQGRAVFHDRDHRSTAPRSTVSQATFGDSPAELPYVTLSPDFDVNRVYNDVQVTAGFMGAIPQVSGDATSQANYGTRTLPRTTQLLTNQAAIDQSARLLHDNKDPHLRFPQMTLDPYRDSRLWPVVLGLEISDRVTVIRRPYAGGPAIQRVCWVEAIQHDIEVSPDSRWTTTLYLSLADPTSYWTLGDATKSLLGSTTFLR